MMISSFGCRKARILQSCFGQGRLVIRKNKLYDFSTLENLERNVNLFMLYACSHCVDDTSCSLATRCLCPSNIDSLFWHIGKIAYGAINQTGSPNIILLARRFHG